MHDVLAICSSEVSHTLALRFEARTTMNTQELTAALLQVFDHHSAKLVTRVDHFVVHICDLSYSTEEIHGPVENTERVFGSHVYEKALCEDQSW